MSAVNVLVQRNAVHILTDGAGYRADGTISVIGPKVALMPHQSCAVAMRGPQIAWPAVRVELEFAAQSFDQLRDKVVPVLSLTRTHYAHLFEQPGLSDDFEIIVGGIDDSGTPSGYIVASHGRYGNEPWTVLPLAGLTCLPNEPELSDEIAEIARGRDADSFDPEIDGLAIMEAQRAFTFEPLCVVGSFAQLSTISKQGVSSRVIHRWPDVIGQPIAA